MGRRIRVLDQTTVNKIAAGEVVESPASVVKELVENSLDADAGKVDVSIRGGGAKVIKVTDDGKGMSPEDARMAFTRHSTSKIAEIEDLNRLRTMGFRGEALASVSAVSRVEMVTRERGAAGQGTRIVVSAGRMLTEEPVGCPEGTTVTVSDLFENVPARKKFLRSTRSEGGRCRDIVTRLMLVNPEISFRLEAEGEEKINTPATDEPRQRASAVFGIKTARSMLSVPSTDCAGISVQGLVSLPWDTRANGAGITIAVDGRVIKNRGLVEAIRRGYGTRLMKGRFPLAVIDLEIPGDRIDVNVHPTKSIVKFSDEGEVFTCLERAVSRAVFGPSGIKKTKRRNPAPQNDTGGSYETEVTTERKPRQIPLMEGEIRPQEPAPGQWDRIPRIEGIMKLPPALPEDASKVKLRVIGQLDKSYILCELGSDLLLVDQHAAHERIRLEMLSRKYSKGSVGKQELLEPIHLEMDPASVHRLLSMEDSFSEMGFLYEKFDERDIVVRSLPTFMGRIEGHDVLKDFATGNEYHDNCTPPDKEFLPEDTPLKDRLLALTACRGAIKAHQDLSLKEMEDLLEDLFDCDIPLHCAHGRPTMVRLPLSALERWFKRVV